MTIFDVFSLCGGLAFFLYGMHVLSAGLEKTAGGKMKGVLRTITGNRFRGLAVGAGVTAVIQSSSAVTVMLVGLVNSGVLELSQAISVTMGSNIGTTMTAWILSLTGIKADGFFLQLLQPKNFSPLIALAGAALAMFSKKQKRRDIGSVCVGFALLMYGMTIMSSAVAPLAEIPQFVSILTAFRNPLLGVLAGTVFTAAIQSSSASVGVLQALSLTGKVTFGSAIPLIMGQNIGTCVSALLATPGTNKNAKRVAVVHVLFNCIGTVVCLLLWSAADALFRFPFAEGVVTPLGIAVVHTIFNVATTAMLLPATKLLERLSRAIIHGEDPTVPTISLDDRLLTVPSFAVSKALGTTVDMADLSKNTVSRALGLFDSYDAETAAQVARMESTLDNYEDALGTYLVSISRCDLNERDAHITTMLLHVINDFERIGDHANNLMQTATEMAEKKLAFSAGAATEMRTLTAALGEILNMTVTAFENNDPAAASKIEPLEQVIDTLIETVRARHITRLQSGNCTIELGFILTDFLTDCERISDHCSNVGVAIIETARGTFQTHARLEAVKTHPSEAFRESYNDYLREFSIDFTQI